MESRRYEGKLIGKPVQHAPSMTAAFVLMIVLGFATLAVAAPALAPMVVMLGIFALGRLVIGSMGMTPLGRAVPVSASVGPDALDVVHGDDVYAYPRRQLRAGYVLPFSTGAVVVLRGHVGDRARFRFDDIAAARDFLHDLGLSPLERPMTFAFFFNLRVTVGADGVVVALPMLGRRQFIPHGAIVDIRQTSRSVVLALRNGTTFDIATGGGEQHVALVERLVEATHAYVDADHAEPLALLRQSGRTAAAWVKELRALMEGAGAGYRSATIPEDTLWRVALDPSEPAEHRIGAGLALRSSLDDDGRARLRVAAEAAASPKVRIGLESAANETDDDAVAEVLQRRL